jgi:hypothetical protein
VFPYYWCNPGPPGSNSTYINSDGVQEARAEYQDASWDAQSQKCTWTEYLEEKLTNEGIGACNAGPCCEGRSMCENNGDRWFDSSCMCAPSPLYLLFDGPWSSALTSAEDGVPFVMRPGTPLNMVGWTKANSRSSGLLVRDRDGNGRIDSGAELYGGATPQPTPPGQPRHGFTALGPEDADGNGWIDKHDPAYELMAVWFDINHNGVSDTGELVGLAAAGIKTLGVSYQTFERTDSNGNTFAFVSDMIVRKKGREYRGTVYDVYPSMAPIQEPRLARH